MSLSGFINTTLRNLDFLICVSVRDVCILKNTFSAFPYLCRAAQIYCAAPFPDPSFHPCPIALAVVLSLRAGFSPHPQFPGQQAVVAPPGPPLQSKPHSHLPEMQKPHAESPDRKKAQWNVFICKQ